MMITKEAERKMLDRSYKQIGDMTVSPENHKLRKRCATISTQTLCESISSFLRDTNQLFEGLKKGSYPLLERAEQMMGKWVLASDPRWKDWSFGCANTLEKSGCLPFCALNLLILTRKAYDITPREVKEFTDDLVEKGYRRWHFANSTKNLGWSEINMDLIRHEFPEFEANNDEEILKILGEPQGIGGAMFYLDQLLAVYCGLKPYEETRCSTWQEVLNCLQDGSPVPVRIDLGISDGNASTGGHYATLLGFNNNQEAVLLDSSADAGIRVVPAERLLNSMLYPKTMVCAWNTMPRG